MSILNKIMSFFPEVIKPTEKKLSFKEKLKWTLITLVLFFIMSMIPLFGLGQNQLEQFEMLSIILGANFGSLLSLGIGPIVTASIVLQLLNGSGIMKIDMHNPQGRKKFQSLQKLLAVFFIIFEAFIYVFMGGLAPAASYTGGSFLALQLILVFQLCLGGFLIMFMDEVISKWGFGSGISLFIAAGVSQQIFLGALSPLPSPRYPGKATGAVWRIIQSFASGDPQGVLLALASILATLLVFAIAVYSQSVKVEIPLSFGKVRGYGFKWPLNFFYTSNIPVILVAALLANIQLWGRLLQRWGLPLLGTFDANNQAASGLVKWIYSPDLIGELIRGGLSWTQLGQAGIYLLLMVVGSVIFAIFWMQTSNMDAKSQAEQIMSSGLQMPGFRRDPRILETVLNKYIWPLTIMGGASVGLLAASADLLGALSRGTGIMLTVMIVYKLYEDIAKQHMMDMHPLMRKFMS